eukprot:gene18043-5702_t
MAAETLQRTLHILSELMRRLSTTLKRSSTVRNKIRDKIREGSTETFLSHVAEFVQTTTLNPRQYEELISMDSEVEKLEHFGQLFEEWYLQSKGLNMVNMMAPWEWYPKARTMRRRIIFHGGPTNSGKTHAALEALTKAKSGIYCAPLKVLATQ